METGSRRQAPFRNWCRHGVCSGGGEGRENKTMADLETELQKIYDSEFHVDIGWLWAGGLDINLSNGAVTGHVENVSEVLLWLQQAIAEHYPESKYHVERMGGKWEPKRIGPPEYQPRQ